MKKNGGNGPERNGTLRDVAKLANVSVSTASRALSGAGPVNLRTEKRIREAAATLRYRPNTLARGLKTQSSRLIGLLVHNLVATSFRLLAETAQRRLGAAGYQVLLGITGDDPEHEGRFLDAIENYRAEGLIVVPTGHNGKRLARLQESGVRIVAAIRSQPDAELETILQADVEGAQTGTKHLLDLGHRRIGLIVGRSETTSGYERRLGHVTALRDHGIPVDEELIIEGPYRPETGWRASTQLMALAEPPTALFVANQEAAMGVMKYLSEHDIKVPDRLSLLCYEDEPWFQWHKPAISFVDNGAQVIADLAVDGLLRWLEQPAGEEADTARLLRVGARLVVRDSCAHP